MRAIFATEDKHPKVLYSLENPEKKLLTFKRLNRNLIQTQAGYKTRTNKSDTWVCVLEDENLIKEARKDARCGRVFKEIDRLPSSGAGLENEIEKDGPSINEIKAKAIRFGALTKKIIKQDGSYSLNATDAEKQEYEILKQELN